MTDDLLSNISDEDGLENVWTVDASSQSADPAVALSALAFAGFRICQWLDTSRRDSTFYPMLYAVQRRELQRGWVYVVKDRMPLMFENRAEAEAQCVRLACSSAPSEGIAKHLASTQHPDAEEFSSAESLVML